MNPCDIFSFWGHCKFVNANSKAKAKVQFAQCKQSENAKKEPCLRLLLSFKLSNIQQSRFKMEKKRVENFQHTSNPTPPNLKMNYSLLVEMPNPPQTAQNTCPISSSMLLFKNQCCSKTQMLPNAPK
jgi:hypothetical protein